MMLTKNLLNLLSGVFLVLASSALVEGNECTPGLYGNFQNVSMCELGTHVVSGAHLSASSAEMGEGTRCVCTLVALSPASQGSFFALNQNPSVSNCSAFVTVRGSSQAQYTCQSIVTNSAVLMNANDVTIEVFRSGSVDFGFCVIIADAFSLGNTFNLTCDKDRPLAGRSTASTVTSTLTSTSLSTSTSAYSSSPSKTTASSSTSTTPVVASSTRGTRDSSGETMTGLWTSGPTPVTGEGTGTSPAGPASEDSGQSQPAFPTVAVVAGVSGALNIVLVVVMVLCCRQRRCKGQARDTEYNSNYDVFYAATRDTRRAYSA